MRLRALLRTVLVAALLTASGPAAADEPPDASSATQPGRSLDRALDLVLRGTADPVGKRTVLLLVDVTRSLREAGFADRLAQALERNAKSLSAVEVGLARCGAKGLVTVAPALDRGALKADLGAALEAASANPLRNLYADVRAAAAAFKAGDGERRLVLVSLDNGDVEDDLEATVRVLAREKVVCDVIAREAYLADSYAWSHAGQVRPPKDTTLTGGDGAWPEIPWGWIFQQYQGHEAAPSGFAAFGLTRLAAASGGHVHLYGASGGKHECSVLGSCPFCSSDHLPPGEYYQPHRVKVLAPLVASRDDVLAKDVHDPWVRATLALWSQAYKEGLLRGRPPVEIAGGSLKLEPRRSSGSVPLVGTSLNLPRLAPQAARLREAGERLLAGFEADLAKIDSAAGSPRHRAAAETSRVLLHLTNANLALFEGWCLDAGPAVLGRADHEVVPPEVPRMGPEFRITGWSYTTHCLCHGLAPYRAQRLSVGPEFAARLESLDQLLSAYFARYDHTPFGAAVRRSGLTTFWPTVVGKVLPPPPRERSSTEEQDAPVTTDRPGRGSGGSGETGPATTGK